MPMLPKLPASLLVGLGILASRLSGLIRNKVFAYYFGDSEIAGVYRAAQRIPNVLQNLLGEGALSASFIPAYARLLAEGRADDAGRLAGAIFGLLSLAVSVLVAVGIGLAPWLTRVIAPGFTGEHYVLTVRLVRIFFPGIGILVLSAWCLGILNSHRRFLLPYAAPVALNAVVVVTLLVFGGQPLDRLVVWTTWGAVVGSLVMFGIQLPTVWRVASPLRLSWRVDGAPTREVIRNFFPALVSRGVAQISSYLDNLLASLVSPSAVGVLGYAQDVYMLPVSLFGIAISAAELPALASATGARETVAAQMRDRLTRAIGQMSFFVIPSSVAFVALGGSIVGVLYRGGRFDDRAATAVWLTLAAATIGLRAATQARLYASGFYALGDTRTPLRYALLRVGLAAGGGALAALYVPTWLGWPPMWGVAGLAAASGVAAWVEFFFLRRALQAEIGQLASHHLESAGLWLCALLAAAGAWAGLGPMRSVFPSWLADLGGLALYGTTYLAAAVILGLAPVDIRARLRRLGRRSSEE
ncbi:MAG: murein biosynthesis integral membrane protein MurJ [Chloracidobacterium sp.]|uniref:Probable lipid II flippase MurJ n=1 Tax=Chloracidobacterium validum TaxID=2821543 RepID=A0ABX8BC28_9BACT|nr:murein biosynthesis integral membrane protein MurJ [Chloracidobacterium validum]QUW02625.1 murein biosynthesis integral membrane protein MurJ [Chloracidobacterium validum]